MLSEREERALAEIERGLDDDQQLSTQMRQRRTRGSWWSLAAAVVGVVVGVLLVSLGLVGEALLLVAVAAAPLAWRTWQHGPALASRIAAARDRDGDGGGG